eukprot:55511_1
MSKKPLFAALTAFNKDDTLKAVETRITHRDGSTAIVSDLTTEEHLEHKSNDKMNSTLRGLSQFPYSYNPSSLKWEVRNDNVWQSIECNETKLSFTEFSISTVLFDRVMDEEKHQINDKQLLYWLQKRQPQIIVFINIRIELFNIIMRQEWIQKMYQSTDSHLGRNTKLWKCCCFSSIPLKSIQSSCVNKREYLVTIQVHLGVQPFLISVIKDVSSIQIKRILQSLQENEIEESICIFNRSCWNQSDHDLFKNCEFILDRHQNNDKLAQKEIDHDQRISNLLRSQILKISGIEYNNDVSDGVCVNCVYFEQ